MIDSLCPRLSNGPIPSFIRFPPQKLAFLKLGETGRNGTDLLLKSIHHRLKKTGALVFFFSIFLESPKGWFFLIWYVYFLSNVCGNSMEFLTMKKLGLYDC